MNILVSIFLRFLSIRHYRHTWFILHYNNRLYLWQQLFHFLWIFLIWDLSFSWFISVKITPDEIIIEEIKRMWRNLIPKILGCSTTTLNRENIFFSSCHKEETETFSIFNSFLAWDSFDRMENYEFFFACILIIMHIIIRFLMGIALIGRQRLTIESKMCGFSIPLAFFRRMTNAN